ncbi:copper amine oxidase N-terminal domain-containing protein [Paenibacillus sp. LjRoot56]|uniref:copper amine oxidase N-terminal domain-containing protein n=1 Tax=Paenibacillus sp. LjRoot56 TaxID=3342333 RepID=UPI003ECC6DE9
MLYRVCVIFVLFAAILLNSYTLTSYANDGKSSVGVKIQLTINDVTAAVNGQKTTLSTPPVLLNNTTMVPLRFIADALKADLTWNTEDLSITLKYAGHSIKLSIDNRIVRIDNQSKTLEQPAVIMNNTTLVPLRFIAENLNQTVAFNDSTKSIMITTPHPSAAEIRIDNLLTASSMGFTNNFFVERPNVNVISMASDHHDLIYILERNAASEMSFILRVYNEVTGEMKVMYSGFDQSFNFDYMDPKFGEQHINASILSPRKLVYDSKLEKLYLMATSSFASDTSVSTVIYEIAPNVRMMTYTIGKTTYHPGNFIVTPDGQHFYFSDILHAHIYAGESGQQANVFMSFTPDKDNVKLAAVENDGKMYVLDATKQSIFELQESGNLRFVAPIDIKEEILRVYEDNGTFYIEGQRQIWEVKTTGETQPYVGLKDIAAYNTGL